ncbi:MAG: serine/threonine protein kinase [bacterium]|nr:serine/threonine protein kinase [bacterium]
MSRPDHERISQLFLEVCELSPEERANRLDHECADDPDLRREVESLLEHEGDVPQILDRGALAASADDESVPERIGPYRILEKLDEGGMGVVYRAEQERPLRREVALKLIKLGIESRQVIARFESERQALALMNHPNIARVFDAGATEDGRPYFVMEFVEGIRINAFCDQHRLNVRQRLELFLQVCDGVQHAHQKAIIHRDIKPSNILVAVVDERPVPKIIDFGISKAIESIPGDGAPATEIGQFVGTPEYMSPEQAELGGGHVDTRSDVYSLGVVLYELLSGSQPLSSEDVRGAGFPETFRRIREEDVMLPSLRLGRDDTLPSLARARRAEPATLVRKLRGDVDWITMKALEKDPARRYSSPAELAADIGRHLSGEIVLAGPPSKLYRAGKFVRRHKVGVVFAAILFALLLGFTVTMTFQRGQIASERDRASQQAVTAERTLELMVEMFRRSNPGASQGDTVTAREVLDGATERIEGDMADDPVIQARLMTAVGTVYRNLGMHDRALELLERSKERLDSLLGPQHPESLTTNNVLAFMYFYRGRLDEAEVLYLENLDYTRDSTDGDDVVVLTAMKGLANVYAEQDRFVASETLSLEMLETARRALGDEHPLTLQALKDIGVMYRMSGRPALAEPYTVEAVDKQRAVHGPRHPHTLSAMNSLAVLYMDLGRHEDSERLYRETLVLKRQVLGAEHPSTLATEYNMACLAALDGRSEEAIATLRSAIERGYPAWRMRDDPDLAALRGDPEFDKLVNRVSSTAAD